MRIYEETTNGDLFARNMCVGPECFVNGHFNRIKKLFYCAFNSPIFICDGEIVLLLSPRESVFFCSLKFCFYFSGQQSNLPVDHEFE